MSIDRVISPNSLNPTLTFLHLPLVGDTQTAVQFCIFGVGFWYRPTTTFIVEKTPGKTVQKSKGKEVLACL